MTTMTNDEIRAAVRTNYARKAKSDDEFGPAPASSCCTGESKLTSQSISLALGYSEAEVNTVPEGANMGLGCGNPQAIAALKAGETVLDLGSGGGFDCFLAARQVGESGYVIGVDMTPEMVNKARRLAGEIGAANVDFRLGEIERVPAADDSVDVIISNCVINLSPEKRDVFRESFRVLKPGGRLAIADIVATAPLPKKIQADMALYTSCVSGASTIGDLETILAEVGFDHIRITPKDDSRSFIREWIPGGRIEDFVQSANIEAVKPVQI